MGIPSAFNLLSPRRFVCAMHTVPVCGATIGYSCVCVSEISSLLNRASAGPNLFNATTPPSPPLDPDGRGPYVADHHSGRGTMEAAVSFADISNQPSGDAGGENDDRQLTRCVVHVRSSSLCTGRSIMDTPTTPSVHFYKTL
jgi:hypothetical protein